jgi:hypothetical protein
LEYESIQNAPGPCLEILSDNPTENSAFSKPLVLDDVPGPSLRNPAFAMAYLPFWHVRPNTAIPMWIRE